MRFSDFNTHISERGVPSVLAPKIEQFLKSIPNIDGTVKIGNVIRALITLPKKAKTTKRQEIMQKLLELLQKKFPDYSPEYNEKGSSIGSIRFSNDPVSVVVKDSEGQGDQSRGKANEHALVKLMEQKLKEYGTLDVIFEDERGKKIAITGVTNIEHTGASAKSGTGIRKADVALISPNRRLPVSIKMISATFWESADRLFKVRALPLLANLVKTGQIELVPSKKNPKKMTLPYSVVMEPTPEEQMITMFGEDLNPDGGIVIQDFEPHHFFQVESKVKIWCKAVIKSKEDIPESHLMVWRVRGDSTRSELAGVPGIRPEASTLKGAIGVKGTAPVILVDINGKIIKRPPKKDVPTQQASQQPVGQTPANKQPAPTPPVNQIAPVKQTVLAPAQQPSKPMGAPGQP
jgi:hypothetical protein